MCQVLQQLAGREASARLAAHFQDSDMKPENAVHSDKDQHTRELFHFRSGENQNYKLMCGCKCHWWCWNYIFATHVSSGSVGGDGHVFFSFLFCSSSTLFHIHAPTHTHTSDLPAVNRSPTLLTSAQLVSGSEGMNALLRGTQLQEAEGEESFTTWFFFALLTGACLDKKKKANILFKKKLRKLRKVTALWTVVSKQSLWNPNGSMRRGRSKTQSPEKQRIYYFSFKGPIFY